MSQFKVFCSKVGIAGMLLAVASAPVWAENHQAGHSAHDNHAKAAERAASGDMTDGEVRKIDLAQGKITLRHAEMKHLDMPPMTMVFVVQDKTALAKLKPGDKVKFKAIQDAGKFTVTEIQVVP
ncbi:MAG: copper-binding protein [Burkholderiales bacterium]